MSRKIPFTKLLKSLEWIGILMTGQRMRDMFRQYGLAEYMRSQAYTDNDGNGTVAYFTYTDKEGTKYQVYVHVRTGLVMSDPLTELKYTTETEFGHFYIEAGANDGQAGDHNTDRSLNQRERSMIEQKPRDGSISRWHRS